jgi:hypothetical protein
MPSLCDYQLPLDIRGTVMCLFSVYFMTILCCYPILLDGFAISLDAPTLLDASWFFDGILPLEKPTHHTHLTGCPKTLTAPRV